MLRTELFIDLETRSRVDLKKKGLYNYANDASTEILVACVAIGDGPVMHVQNLFAFLQTHVDSCTFVAHNSAFERAILKKMLEHLPVQWEDTMHLAAYNNLPLSLAECAEILGLAHQKDKRGSFLIAKLCKPQADGTFNTDLQLKRELVEYCKRDVETMRELYYALRPKTFDDSKAWSYERKIADLDREVNARGIAIDVESVNAFIDAIAEESQELNAEVEFLTQGELASTNSRSKTIAMLAVNGDVLTGYTRTSVSNALTMDLHPVSKRLLEIRQLTGLASVKKLYAMRDFVSAGGRLYNTLAYLGATQTGRWAGRGVQIQNFTKAKIDKLEDAIPLFLARKFDDVKMLYGPIHTVVSQLLRSLITAKIGFTLVAADFSNIEGRVLAWLSGQQDLLDLYRSGKCVYRQMASRIYGKRPEDITSAERTLGKVAVLGLGYGMGVTKFVEACSAYGITISLSTAQQVKNVFREGNAKIVYFWDALERAFCSAIMGGAVTVGKVCVFRHNDFVKIRLPSGRTIAYYKPWLETGKIHYGSANTTYSGKIAENVTQAVARDILADSLLRVSATQRVVFHVHDEIVLESEEWRAEANLSVLIKTMETPPVWAVDLPLKAEGWINKRYRK